MVVGQAFDIRFTVRQHGVRLVNGLRPIVRLTHAPSGEQVVAIAQPTDSDGQYTATLRLPHEGQWDWEIEAFGPAAPLAPLQVVAAATSASAVQPSIASNPALWLETLAQPWLLVTLAIASAGVGLLLPGRRVAKV